jgi:hypothetical protein
MRTSTVTVTNVHKPADGAPQVNPVSASSTQSPHWPVVALSFGSVAVAAAIMCFTLDQWLKPPIFHTVTGYIPLAGIVAVSTALERFLEPISSMLPPMSQSGSKADRTAATKAKNAATKAMNDSEAAARNPNTNEADKTWLNQQATQALTIAHAHAIGLTAAQAMDIAHTAAIDPQLSEAAVTPILQTAADKTAQLRADRTVFFWALASICGLVISGGFGFLLLQAISSQHVNQCLDLIVTGLVIGAGTKPLHDLITGIQSK